MSIWSPSVTSVSSSELGDAVVVSVTPDRSIVPVFDSVTERCIVSPAATVVALMLSRFVDVSVAPRAITTVPVATLVDADVELVNVANVPSPATADATPTTANDVATFVPSDRSRKKCTIQTS